MGGCKVKRNGSCVVTGLLMVAFLLRGAETVPAAIRTGPGGEVEAQSEVEEQLRGGALNDGILEYGELAELIHRNNPDVMAITDAYEKTLADYENAREALRIGRADASRRKREAKEAGDAEEYAYNMTEEATFQSALDSYKKVADRLKSPSNTSDQRRTERHLTAAARALMISYDLLRQQMEISEQQKTIGEKQYQLVQEKAVIGMASAEEVRTADIQLLSVKASIVSLDEQMSRMHDNLCIMVGEEPDGTIRIQPISPPDMGRVGEINLETDILRAIGNNETLIDYRHNLDSDSTSSRNYKARTIAEGEEKLKIEMERLYADVQQKMNRVMIAQTGYDKAAQAKGAGDAGYRAGILSGEDYLEAELDFLQATADLQSANLALQQSMDTYDWAVLGALKL